MVTTNKIPHSAIMRTATSFERIRMGWMQFNSSESAKAQDARRERREAPEWCIRRPNGAETKGAKKKYAASNADRNSVICKTKVFGDAACQ